MSTSTIIKELIDENLIGAKKEIEDLLYAKLGEHLHEKYTEIAPTLLEKKKKKLDPVGDEDADIDNDGDEDDDDKYLGKRREAIARAIKMRKEDADPNVLRPNAAGKDEPGDLSGSWSRNKVDKKNKKKTVEADTNS